jgi:predicted PurR-regulated permease PerM
MKRAVLVVVGFALAVALGRVVLGDRIIYRGAGLEPWNGRRMLGAAAIVVGVLIIVAVVVLWREWRGMRARSRRPARRPRATR